MKFELNPGKLTFSDIKNFLNNELHIKLSSSCIDAILESEETVAACVLEDEAIYGINTGFGSLANKRIDYDQLEVLQKNLILSHAAGTGEYLSDTVVRLMLLLKINSLARGFSGIRLKTIEALLALLNAKVYPCIPCQGSVGASGDLAPLAHLSAILMGVGEVRHRGTVLTAEEGLQIAGLEPITFSAKEGLALINGTQASTALALLGLFEAEKVLLAGLISGAMTVDAVLASTTPFDERIQNLRGHRGQIMAASILRQLLHNSEINLSHVNCTKVQDPYSLRCQPQVMGACLTHLLFTADILLIEANSVTDNPLVFSAEDEILSGGNFHAEPVAMAADTLALSIAEIGALSERRIALLVDSRFSSLPAFLIDNPGINSGFMIPQVTAAALASENKALAHPSSIDSLPTSANQEDHVSMATYCARRLLPMAENTAGIIAIELLAACQGIDFRRPLKTSALLETVHAFIRNEIPFYETDRYFAPDLAIAKTMVTSGVLNQLLDLSLLI